MSGGFSNLPKCRTMDARTVRTMTQIDTIRSETDLSDNPDFVEIAKAYRIHGWRLNESAMAEFPVSKDTGDSIDNFLRSPGPELLVFDCHPEANVYPMVPVERRCRRWFSGTNRNCKTKLEGTTMQVFHIRYRNAQGALMRILNAASRRGLKLGSVHAEAAGQEHGVTLLLEATQRAARWGQLGRQERARGRPPAQRRRRGDEPRGRKNRHAGNCKNTAKLVHIKHFWVRLRAARQIARRQRNCENRQTQPAPCR